MGIEIVYGAGAVILLVALIWGANHRSRRQGERKVGDATTERLYKSGDPES